MLLAAPALAQEAGETPAADGGTATEVRDNPVETSRPPLPRPEGLQAEAEAEAIAEEVTEPLPEQDVQQVAPPPAGEGVRDVLALSQGDYDECLAALDGLGTVYEEVEAIRPGGDADCGIVRPLTVTELLPGLALSTPATLRCPAVLATALWARDFVLPAAQRLNRGALTVIDAAPSYICRETVGGATAKPSEHSYGNALDVQGFRFAEGAAIPVQPREAEGTLAEAFQDAVRASACMEFATVLGPGSNAAHADHLHLDIKARRGGYRLCEQGGANPEAEE
jgi:hypothetical protein